MKTKNIVTISIVILILLFASYSEKSIADILFAYLWYSAIAAIYFYIGWKIGKDKRVSYDAALEIEKIKFLEQLNPIVKLIYLQFISNSLYQYFQPIHCEMLIANLDITYWDSNDVCYREFTKIPDQILKEYNLTISEINKTLTLADKKVLDTISKKVRKDNAAFINRLFTL